MKEQIEDPINEKKRKTEYFKVKAHKILLIQVANCTAAAPSSSQTVKFLCIRLVGLFPYFIV